MMKKVKADIVILVVVLVILGIIVCIKPIVYFYNQMKNTANKMIENDINVTEYNSKFLDFEGKISGLKAIELCDIMKQHNSINNKGNGIIAYYNQSYINDLTVSIADDSLNIQIDNVEKMLKIGKIYEVELIYDNQKGIVSAINFKEL